MILKGLSFDISDNNPRRYGVRHRTKILNSRKSKLRDFYKKIMVAVKDRQ